MLTCLANQINDNLSLRKEHCSDLSIHGNYILDYHHKNEHNFVFSVIHSILDELNLEEVPFEYEIKFKSYLLEGIDRFYYLALYQAFDNYNPNSIDGFIALIIIGLYYGISDSRYQDIKKLIFSEDYFDRLTEVYYPIDEQIENCYLKYNIYRPSKNIYNSYFQEHRDPSCYQIKDETSIVFLSNWANNSISSIEVLRAIKKLKPDYLIHIGNVYYSGTVHEHLDNLITPLNSLGCRKFILPGVHSYYSGTLGVDYALRSIGQNAPYFSLYNKHLQIEGLDTSYHNSKFKVFYHDSDPSITSWHNHRVKIAKVNGRRIFFVSYHSPVSIKKPLDEIDGDRVCVNKKLIGQFKGTIDDLDGWFFSQERSFDLMEPYVVDDHVIVRPRLIGNSSAVYLSEDLTGYPGDFDLIDDRHPIPISMNIFPSRYTTMLNPTYTVMKVNAKRIKITYYELPQKELGIYSPPIKLFQEKIEL